MQHLPSSTNFIHIDSELSSSRVLSRITVSENLEKYFLSYDYFSEYDEPILDETSILNIPALSIVLPIAWITGADVYAEELDETYTHSMEKVQEEYKKIYPKAPFKTKLIAKKKVKQDNYAEGTALLFSGGVDSTYTLFEKIDLNPRLIMLFGVMDIPIENTELHQQIKARYTAFARKANLKLNFINTNALNLLNHERLRHLWGKYQETHEGDYWNGIGYSLGHIGQAAPISINRFNKLLFAASYDSGHSVIINPDASSPEVDEKIEWSNLKVIHDSDLHRSEKVKRMREFLTDNGVYLRVCWSDSKYLTPNKLLNCSKCEKCLRTIVALILAEVDPNKCGFNVSETTFELIRYLLTEKVLTKKGVETWWKPLQQSIPENIETDIHGSKKFFEWFRECDLDKMGKTYRTMLHSIYFNLPFTVSNYLKKIFDLITSPSNPAYEPYEIG